MKSLIFYLFFYMLYYVFRRANGPYPTNRGIIYPALGTIGVGIVANRVQLGTMREHNGRLREGGRSKE